MKLKLLLLISLIFIAKLNAQFDSLIFSYPLKTNYRAFDIYSLGDQNKDGFDDFMLYDCEKQELQIFFGGNPPDTIPKYKIKIERRDIGIIDLNDDNIKDIVITTFVESQGKVEIFYGGSEIDTIANLIFNAPEGSSNVFGNLYVLADFNGDGRNELVIADPFLPNSNKMKQNGVFYIYNTEAAFDTIPHVILEGDTTQNKELITGFNFSSGDLNGDGKTDFTIYAEQMINDTTYRFFRNFYFGNSNFNLVPSVTYYQDEHTFDIEQMRIIEDVNGDGKDDMLMRDYYKYPSYYYNAISYGKAALDTLLDVGLNTQNEGINTETAVPVGDVNGDGYNDILVQTLSFLYANVKVWVGGKYMPHKIDDESDKTWAGTSGGFGRIIGKVGDVDGDGVDDIAIGKQSYGAYPEYYCTDSRIYIFKGDTTVKGDTTTGIKEINSIQPEGYKLDNPYPNPFNPSTIIRWELAEGGKVTLKVYDTLGREITELINKFMSKGVYEYKFDALEYSLSSGVYFLEMQAYKNSSLKFTQTKKLSIIK